MRFVVLVAGLAVSCCKAARPEESEGQSVALAARVALVADSAEAHISQLPREELHRIKSTAHVAILEEKGFPLSRQFRQFAILEAARQGFFDEGVDGWQQPQNHVLAPHKIKKTFTFSALLDASQASPPDLHANTSNTSEILDAEIGIRGILQTIDSVPRPVKLDPRDLARQGILRKTINESDWDTYDSFYKYLVHLSNKSRNSSVVPEPGAWMDAQLPSHPEPQSRAIAKRCGKGSRFSCRAGQAFKSSARDLVEESYEVRSKVLELMLGLGDVSTLLKKQNRVDWAEVTSKKGAFNSAVNAFIKVKRGTSQSIRRMYKNFAKRREKVQDECNEKERQWEAKHVQSLPNLTNESSIESVEAGLSRSQDVLRQAEARGQRESKALDGMLQQQHKEMDEIEHDAAQGNVDIKQIEAKERKEETMESQTCDAKAGAEASAFNKQIGVVKRSISKLPDLGIRGAGGWASVMAGSLEEIISFRKREIGYFMSKGAVVGTSMSGLSLAGFVGLGWLPKVEKDIPLRDSGTGASLFVSAGVTLPVPVSLSAAVTLEVDADEQKGGPPYVPLTWDPGVAAYFGWGMSVGTLPIPVAMDVGSMYSEAIHVECFKTTKELIQHLWGVGCVDCKGSMKASLLAFRTLTHAASFPVITDLFFTWLAALIDRRGETTGCSKENDANALFSDTVNKIGTALRFIEGIESESGSLSKDLQASRSIVAKSKEFETLRGRLESLDIFCPKISSLNNFSPGALGIRFAGKLPVWLHPADLKRWLLWQGTVKLHALCHDFGAKKCTVETMSKLLQMNNAQTNPFGVCDHSHKCQLRHTRCVRFFVRAKNFVASNRDMMSGRGQCQCQQGYCARLSSRTGIFECKRTIPKGSADAVSSVLEDLRSWLEMRKLELGDYVRDVLSITREALSQETRHTPADARSKKESDAISVPDAATSDEEPYAENSGGSGGWLWPQGHMRPAMRAESFSAG